MLTPNEATGIETMAYELIEKLKRYSESQKELWQKIPYLALQADGRDRYSYRFNLAYRHGYWGLTLGSANSDYTIYVDLESGCLVDPDNLTNSPSDKDLLTLALHLDKINARKIISNLKNHTRKPIRRGYNNPGQARWRKEWRDRLIAKYNLNPDTYKRVADTSELTLANSATRVMTT